MSEGYSQRQSTYYYNPTKNQQHMVYHPPTSKLKSYQEMRNSHDVHLGQLQSSTIKYMPKIIESGYIVGAPVAYTHQPTLPTNYVAFSPTKSNIPIIMETSNNHTHDISPINSRLIYPPPQMLIHHPPTSQPHKIIQNQYRNYVIHQQQQQSPSSPPPQVIFHHSQVQHPGEIVPKVQYDRCLSQCKNWETKYNELYLKHMMTVSNQNRGQNYELMLQQNHRLTKKIRQLQHRQKMMTEQFQNNFQNMIQKYKQSTLKQCYLLIDRYRLQCKQQQR